MTKPIITKTSVTYSRSRTINMGNYESENVQAGITFESVTAGSEEALFAEAEKLVEAKLDEITAEVSKSSLNKVTKNKVETSKPAKEEKAEEDEPKKEKKPTKKKAKKEEPEEEDVEIEEVDEDSLTIDHVCTALREYAKEHGKPAAKSIMEDVAGVKKMDDIPQEKFSDVILACEDPPETEEEDDDDLDD